MLHLDDGTAVVLGARLAKAGEGTIYTVDSHPQWAAKIFHPKLRGLDEKRDKVKAMTLSQPQGAVQHNGFVVLAWPQHVITDNEVVGGYVMPKIDTSRTVEIHAWTNPTSRMSPIPAGRSGQERIVEVPFERGRKPLPRSRKRPQGRCRHRRFSRTEHLVSDTSRVTLVDCDSMQITEPSGRTFGCQVGRPEFTAPEVFRGQARSCG